MRGEGISDVAEADESVPLNWGEADAFVRGVAWCANWLTAIVGMAEAISQRSIPDHVDVWCARCVGLEQAHHPDCNWAP